MPKLINSGAKGTFEFPDDASDAEIQAALAELDRPAVAPAPIRPQPAVVTAAPSTPTDYFGPIRRAGESIGRFAGHLAGSPTVQAVSGVADRVVADAPVVFRGLRDVASNVAGAAGAVASNTLPARVLKRGYENFMLPVRAYNAVRTPVANFVGDVAGTVVPPALRAVERAAPYLEYANPLAKALSLPARAAVDAGGRVLAGAAEAAVPPVFAVRDSLSRAGAAVSDAAQREADYWSTLPTPPRTPAAITPSPVVRIPQYPQAPANPKERVVGEVYLTPKAGPMMWDGTRWTDIQRFER